MFYIIDPIKVLTGLAPQNDCLNLSFVKDYNVVGKKMTRNSFVLISSSQILRVFVRDYTV